MADKQWSAEEMREAMSGLAHLDVEGAVARARDLGGDDASRYREALLSAGDFALHFLSVPWDAIPESEKERLTTTAHSLQEQLLPFAEQQLLSSARHLGEAASVTGDAAQAVGEAAGKALEAVGEALSFLG